jgi:dolichyl-phosphate-mannose-protein mannosyltransferase
MSLETIQRRGEALRAWFLARTEKDAAVILCIIILAALLRIPFLGHPDQTLFDEVMHANFAMHLIHATPFFDIHPPLARMIFAQVAGLTSFDVSTIPMDVNQSFQDFPYILLRFFVAIFGVLLAVLVYTIGRLIGYSPRIALIPALCVVFDNALVLYARSILPDTILLVFACLGFAAAFAATTHQAGWKRWALVCVAGIALGAAVSIKWTALGVVGLVMLCYAISKMYWEVICSLFMIACVYVLLFALFLSYFSSGGKTGPMIPTYDVPIVTQLEFPKDHNLRSFTSFFIAHHRAMIETNRDPEITKGNIRAPGPLAWPLAKSAIIFWRDATGSKVMLLMGNSLLWFVTFFVLLFELFWITARILRDHTLPIDRTEGILLAGYLMNYLPFFFIQRPMYLYHYFTALLFLFLLLPRIVPRIIDCVARVSNDRPLAYTLTYFVGFLMLINFFLLAPITYGL